MKKLYEALYLSMLCGAIVACGSLAATEVRNANEMPENSSAIKARIGTELRDGGEILLQLGERTPLSKEEKQELKKQQIEESGALQAEGIEAAGTEVEAGVSAKDQAAYLTYSLFHGGVYHTVSAVTYFDDYITLNDGLTWFVRPADRYKAAHLYMVTAFDFVNDVEYRQYKGDILLIEPAGFFSAYDFVLVNQSTKERIEVDLVEPAYGQIIATYSTTAIYPYNGMLDLGDFSTWTVSAADRSKLFRWSAGDSITMGINNELFPSSYSSNILINVNLNEYIRAEWTGTWSY